MTHIISEVAGQDIGLIGAGRMGTGIGISLLRHGANVRVKSNTNRAGIDRLIQLGAQECFSIAQLAGESKIVLLSLPSSREVEQVCLEQNGLFRNLAPNGLILDCTTSYPASTLALAEEAQKHGLYFVDAPVTRSPEQAEQGRLNVIVGADAKTFARAAGILAAFCEGIVHAGSVGTGHKLKLVYNGMTMGLAAVAAETCQLADALDVDLDILRTIVSRGSTNSGIFQKFAAFLLNEEPDALSISIATAAKDAGYALQLAGEANITALVLASASQKLQAAINAGKGELTLPHVAQSERRATTAEPVAARGTTYQLEL